MTWKEKTCEKCVFRVGDECRRFPPNDKGNYPFVSHGYLRACAEYAETMPEKTSFALPFKPFPEDVRKKLEDDWNRAIDNAFSRPPNIRRKG